MAVPLRQTSQMLAHTIPVVPAKAGTQVVTRAQRNIVALRADSQHTGFQLSLE
jgi:hypothetical protein